MREAHLWRVGFLAAMWRPNKDNKETYLFSGSVGKRQAIFEVK